MFILSIKSLDRARKITKDYLKLYYEKYNGIAFDFEGVWINGFRYEIRDNKVYLLDIDKFLLDMFYKNSLIEIPDVFEELDFINHNLYDFIHEWDKPFSLEADGVKNFKTKIFSGSKIEDISLKSCVSIGDDAFRFCLNLKNVVIPKIKYIGNNSFEGDSLLSNIDIRTVKRIGEKSFDSCNNCSFVGDEYPNLLEIGESAFSHSGIERMIANRLKEVPKNAFNSSSLTYFKGDRVVEIREYGFYCSELLELDCPNLSLISFNCLSMIPIEKLECYAKYINGRPFVCCVNLRYVSFPVLKKLEQPLFYQCNHISTLSLPSCVSIQGGLTDSDISDVYLPSLKRFTGASLSWDVKKTKVHLSQNCEIDPFYWEIFKDRIIIDL